MVNRYVKDEIDRKAKSFREVGIEAALVETERDKTLSFKGWALAGLTTLYQIKTGAHGVSSVVFTASTLFGAATLPIAYISHNAFKEAYRGADTTEYAAVETHRKRAWRNLTYSSFLATASLVTTPIVLNLTMTVAAVGMAASSVFNWLDASRIKMQRRIRRMTD